MLRRIAHPMFFALALAMLAACSQTTPDTGGAAAPAAPAASDAVPATPAASDLFADIEQGATPEGYHTLGSASAPVTLVMYSDFL